MDAVGGHIHLLEIVVDPHVPVEITALAELEQANGALIRFFAWREEGENDN